MNQTLKSIGFFTGIFLQLLLTLAVLIVSWNMAFTSVDLNKAKQIYGNVSSVDIQQNGGSKPIAGQMALIIHLSNIDSGFWIYRSGQNYSDIQAKLSVGDIAKVYCEDFPGSNGYYTAFQIESNGKLIYSKNEFESKEKLAGRFIGLPGVLALLFTVYIQIKRRYKKKSLPLSKV